MGSSSRGIESEHRYASGDTEASVATSIRPIQSDDESFVYSTWLKNYRHSSTFAREIRDGIFFKFHHKVIERILKRGVTSIVCLQDDPNTILGYLVTEEWEGLGILHYCYVKYAFRQMGLATRLIKSSDVMRSSVEFSHLTEDIPHLLKVIPTMQYNPYLI